MPQLSVNIVGVPASTALTLVLRRSHNVCTTNRHFCGSGERNGKQRKTKLSFGRTMMQTLELLGWQKGMSRDKVMLISEKIKPVAIAVIELCLSECISQSAENSVK